MFQVEEKTVDCRAVNLTRKSTNNRGRHHNTFISSEIVRYIKSYNISLFSKLYICIHLHSI